MVPPQLLETGGRGPTTYSASHGPVANTGPAANSKLVIVNFDPNQQQQQQHLVQYVDDGEEEEEEEVDEIYEEDPDYNPPDENDEGYRTSSVTSGSPSTSYGESPRPSGTMVTGTVGEATEDEHGNLMWLVDFKLDFLTDIDKDQDDQNNNNTEEPDKKKPKLDANPPQQHREVRSNDSLRPPTIRANIFQEVAQTPYLPPPPQYHPRPPAPPPLQHSVNRAKPNYTYTDLITLALKDKTALTVSGIYQWITENFPYFRAEDDRWKNSVRHNLSMNPHFRKGTKSKHGAGHVWVLASETEGEGEGSYDRNGLHPVKLISNEAEAAEAVRKILNKSSKSEQMTRQPPTVQYSSHGQPPSYQPHPQLQPHHQATNDLQRAAEEILAGVKRPTAVESTMVQFVNGDMYLRENVTPAAVPVNLSTSSTVSAPSHYEITVYDHQDAAITLSSLEQVSLATSELQCPQFLSLQQF